MKIKRYKKVNKYLSFFTNNFGFRQPYQLLIDGTFCFAALNNKINIADNIPKYLQGEIKILTTQCAIVELESLGSKLHGALIILKQFAVHKCGHEGKPVLGSYCLMSMLGKNNENHYILATQDRDLQSVVRNKPGVPLLYLHLKTPVLEQPSQVSVQAANNKQLGLSKSEVQTLEELKIKHNLIETEERPRKKRKKGPNPLSCKRKKDKNLANPVAKKERTLAADKIGKKIRIPQHIKEALLKNKTTQ